MIKKRDGHEVPYEREKIKAAVEKDVTAMRFLMTAKR